MDLLWPLFGFSFGLDVARTNSEAQGLVWILPFKRVFPKCFSTVIAAMMATRARDEGGHDAHF
jgi:hypothetical protein